MATRCGILFALILFVPPPSTISMNLNPTYNQQQSSNDLFHVLDMKMLQKLDRMNTGNILVSPLSVKQVLAMVLEGATGDSATELTDALNSLYLDKNKIKDQFKAILKQLGQNQDSVKFKNANRIYISENMTADEQFEKIIKQYYQSDIRPVNFGDTNTINEINQWVKKVTNGLIPSLIKPNAISESTSIILANALYFKGTWETSFNRESTLRTCFYQTAKTNDCNYFTNMMVTNDMYNYAEWKMNDLEVKALEIPYEGKEYSMLILLPTQNELFSRMVNILDHIYPDILKKLSRTEVTAYIPRFSIEFDDDLVRVLEEIGIKGIFDQTKSELTHMIVNATNIHVSNVFHKAKIEVNEEGTIAAAATGFVVIPLMGTSKPVFRADHPFIFFVRHIPTGAILFAGKVKKPEQAEAEEPREELTVNRYQKNKPAVQNFQDESIRIEGLIENQQTGIHISKNGQTVYTNNPQSEQENSEIVFGKNEPEQMYNTPETRGPSTRRNMPQLNRYNNNEQVRHHQSSAVYPQALGQQSLNGQLSYYPRGQEHSQYLAVHQPQEYNRQSHQNQPYQQNYRHLN